MAKPPPGEKTPRRTGGSYRCGSGEFSTDLATAVTLQPEPAAKTEECPEELAAPKVWTHQSKPKPEDKPSKPSKPKKPEDTAKPGDKTKVVPRGRVRIQLDAERTQEARKAGDTDACVYEWVRTCAGRGRPLMAEHGESRVASQEAGQSDWTLELETLQLDGLSPELRARLGASWREDAALEHASVAAFGRVALELMAVGAPPELIAEHHRAALDEIRHARVCWALAEACDGIAAGPGPLDTDLPARKTLREIMIGTFLEGCVAETIAALSADRAARACTEPTIAQALVRIAEEEGEHSALAWRTVAWALSIQPALARDLMDVAAVARDAAVSESAPATNAVDRELEALGYSGDHAEWRAKQDAWAEVIDPALALLAG